MPPAIFMVVSWLNGALQNSGYSLPMERITANFTPDHLKKEEVEPDLSIVVGILSAIKMPESYLEIFWVQGKATWNPQLAHVSGYE